MAEWKTHRLGNITTWKSGGTPSKQNESYWSGTIPWLSARTFNSNRIYDSETKISSEGLENGSRLAKENTILLLVRGSGLFNGIPIGIVKKPVAFNQDIKCLEPNEEIVLPEYLLYWLLANRPLLESKLEHTGIGAGKFDTEQIKSLKVDLPDLPTQNAIAEILSSLDDKIELNNQINKNLEALAQAIFKRWFVDFEFPDENGQPYKSSGGEMVESELGMIPEGWCLKPVYDCADYINGAAYKDMYFTDEKDALPVVKIAELKNGVSSGTKYTNTNLGEKYRIDRGDILFSWSGSPDTSIDTFLWTKGPAWLNQHIFKVVCRNPEERSFVFFMLKYLKARFIAIAKNKQTTGLGHVTIKDLKEMRIPFPNKKKLKEYDGASGEVLKLIESNLVESGRLSLLRDVLLPRLITGKMAVTGGQLHRLDFLAAT